MNDLSIHANFSNDIQIYIYKNPTFLCALFKKKIGTT